MFVEEHGAGSVLSLILPVRDDTEVAGTRPGGGYFESFLCQPALDQHPDRGGPAWHALAKAPVVNCRKLLCGQHDLQPGFTGEPGHNLRL